MYVIEATVTHTRAVSTTQGVEEALRIGQAIAERDYGKNKVIAVVAVHCGECDSYDCKGHSPDA